MNDKEMIEEKDKFYILNTILQEVKPLKLREKIYWRIVEFIDTELPKDSVVLSREEKQKLLKGMYEQGKFDALADIEKDGKVVLTREGYDILIAVENERIKEAKKEAVKEILRKVDYESNGQTKQITDLLRKQYCVEIEE